MMIKFLRLSVSGVCEVSHFFSDSFDYEKSSMVTYLFLVLCKGNTLMLMFLILIV